MQSLDLKIANDCKGMPKAMHKLGSPSIFITSSQQCNLLRNCNV